MKECPNKPQLCFLDPPDHAEEPREQFENLQLLTVSVDSSQKPCLINNNQPGARVLVQSNAELFGFGMQLPAFSAHSFDQSADDSDEERTNQSDWSSDEDGDDGVTWRSGERRKRKRSWSQTPAFNSGIDCFSAKKSCDRLDQEANNWSGASQAGREVELTGLISVFNAGLAGDTKKSNMPNDQDSPCVASHLARSPVTW